jgi:hypothetical protein
MLTGTCHCGATQWTLDAEPNEATACNCTICRRYGALWTYGHYGEDIHVAGPTAVYRRSEPDTTIENVFCPTCACMLCCRAMLPDANGRRRSGVNVRLAPPEAVAHLPIRHFDGLGEFVALPSDGRCVRDLWF